MMPPLFDSHCHINAPEFAYDRADVIRRMKAAGLVGAMVIGCEEKEIGLVTDLVRGNPGFLYGAWALHPEYEVTDEHPEVTLEHIVDVCSAPEMAAVGETGLDYHWCKGDLTWQKNRFRRHIEAALHLKKPLIVHAREAEDDALAILTEMHAGDVGFVLHCFGGTMDCALKAVDAGGLVSFTGVVTFKSATALAETAEAVPLEKLMVETDCPYMAPVPYRGKRNEPAFVAKVAEKIATVKDLPYDEVAWVTTENALNFFHLNHA